MPSPPSPSHHSFRPTHWARDAPPSAEAATPPGPRTGPKPPWDPALNLPHQPGMAVGPTRRHTGPSSILPQPSDIIGHFVSSIVCHYKSQWALRLVGRGRPKSDVTRGLTSHEVIWEGGCFKPCLQLETSTRLPRN
ncbi:hypothetical protein CRENBAI_011640 [Crenichthys baileyi]|uniref:Uncharacterized protein n=1 Tax=Crenichthys baileyi TaxID=28760 RepID=A0AAV9R9L8_9TELE